MESFTPMKRGGGKSFSRAEGGGGGGTKRFEVVLTRELEVLTIVIGGCKKFPPFKRWAQKVFHCLEGGGRKKFRTCDFPIL